MNFFQKTKTTLPGERTNWIPNEVGSFPVRPGVYEVYWVQFPMGDGVPIYAIYYSYWNRGWHGTGITFEFAESAHFRSENYILGWRGLTVPS